MTRHYFLGGNTPNGFHSYYEYLLDPERAKKIYIIKGGPGTGKSTAMKEVGKWAEDGGYDVDYLHCSSDPDSLDGIIIDGDIAMVDGTAPHVVDPKTPGCVDTIVNMGDFWDEAKLREKKDKIIASNKKIKKYFKTAYNYLAAAGEIYKNILGICDGCSDKKMPVKIAENIFAAEIKRESTCGCGRVRKLFASAIGPLGMISFADTLRQKKSYVIKADLSQDGNAVLQRLAGLLTDSGYDVDLFYDPLCPDKRIEHLNAPEAELSVVTGNFYNNIMNTDAHVIDLDEIMSKETCGREYVYNKILVDNLIYKASETIAKAKLEHDLLEQCYIPCMDFEALNQNTKKLIDDIKNNKR